MSVEIIKHISEFDSLCENWKKVYRADEEAQWFLSWQWLSQLYDRRDGPIRILAYRHRPSDRGFVAFFPLRRQVQLSKRRVELSTIYRLPGNYWADYTGLISTPEHEQAAVSAFGRHVAAQPWSRLYLENMWISDRRLDALLRYFKNNDFTIRRKKFGENTPGPDLSRSPQIALPSTFEEYLTERLSANTRQRIRRYRRKLAADPSVNIRYCTVQTLSDDLANFEQLWKIRWANEKGEKVDKLARRYSLILRQAITDGDMLMAVMTHLDRPIGMVACYVDDIKRTLLFFVAARDASYPKLPVGLLLHTYLIEFAVQRKFTRYDFLRGDEPYKYSLGATDKLLKTVIVSSSRSAIQMDKQQPWIVEDAIAKLCKYQSSGTQSDIHKLYADLLTLWPNDPRVLTSYADWNAGCDP